MVIKVEIKGLRELQAKFDSLPKQLQTEVRATVENGAKEWVRGAKRDCKAVDVGFLRNGISYAQVIASKTKSVFEVVSNAEYSPYIEWGTITKVDVPGDLTNYAIQFKGRGLRKNGGILPRPFFFKQRPLVQAKVEKGIQSILSEIK